MSNRNVWVAAALLLPALFIGALAGADLSVVAVGFFVVVLGAAVYVQRFFAATRGELTDLAFWALLALTFLGPLIQAATGVSLSFLGEVFLFAASPLALLGLVRRRSNVPGLRWYVALLVVFLCWQILVTLKGRSHLPGATYQFLTNLKPFLLLVFGFGVAWSDKTQRAFWCFVRWVGIFLVPFVLFQWAAPSLFIQIFAKGAFIEHVSNPFVPALVRAQGPLGYSSVLATLAIQLLILCAFKIFYYRERVYFWPAAIYFFLVLASGQRQEAAVMVLVLLMALAIVRWRFGIAQMVVSCICAGALLLGLVSLVAGDAVREEANLWDSGTVTGPAGARAALYVGAVTIAQKYQPFGSGLGTYGGAGAAKFDTRMYIEAGLGDYWWFKRGQYLMDSIWACYIAELGWAGAAMLALLFALPLLLLIKKSQGLKGEDRGVVGLAFCLAAYAILVSPTAFVINDPGMGLLSFIFVGLALRKPTAAVA
jgi:hypothetical protein